MNVQQSVELKEDICRIRFRGECNLVEATELIRKALAQCRERSIRKVLFDATGLTGLPIPSLVDRFLMVEEWALEARGLLVMSLVVQAEYIHPHKFGVKVANDLGLKSDVFSVESEALAWLSKATQ